MRFSFSIYLLLPLLVIGAVCQYEGTLATSKLSGAVSMASGAEIVPGSLPEWWKHDPTDTDGDGMPDLWERWTYSNPLVADSHIDRDGDGLTDLEEFWYQTDPRTASTMGDGLPDGLKVLHGYDPLKRETFVIDELDEDGDGVIDAWLDSGYLYGFVDVNANGFDDRLEAGLQPMDDKHGDILVTVMTSRSAALTWGNQGLVLSNGTWRIRLRLPLDEDSCVALGQYDGASGTWKASLKWEWHESVHDRAVGLRMKSGDTQFLEGPEDGESLTTIIGTPARAMATQAGATSYSPLYFRTGKITVTPPVISFCTRHNPNSDAVFSAQTIGPVKKPLQWYYGDLLYATEPAGEGDSFAATGSRAIYCIENGGTPPYDKEHACAICSIDTFECPLPETRILGAIDRDDHTPVTELQEDAYGSCITTNTNVYIGFDHSRVNTSNLVLIARHAEEQYQKTHHCLGLIWEKGGSIDLRGLLAINAQPYMSQLHFTTNGVKMSESVIEYEDEAPKDMDPLLYAVNVLHTDGGVILDRLWVVVNSQLTEDSFNEWYAQNSTNMAWTLTLPPPYSSIEINDSNRPVDPEPGVPDHWAAPNSIASYLHHDAVFEMRTENRGAHGHQATYTATGALITNTIAAGTADFERPYLRLKIPNGTKHRNADVRPFIRALQLDGNPVLPNGQRVPTNLNRPCIYQGSYTDKYINCRPITPTGTRER